MTVERVSAAALWTPEALADAAGGVLEGRWAQSVRGFEIDSRALSEGDVFVALTTGARDGHDFVAAALAAGAAGALVCRDASSPEEAPLLRVRDDTLDALGRIAAAARARLERAHVVGVTGSAGKTTVKDMVRAMGAAVVGAAATHAAVKSFNNHIGVPLTLARTPPDIRLAAIEIGMNHPGEIAPLARLAAPHAAIVTTVAPAHLEAFPSVAAIADEKASIADGLVEDGVAILNRDVEHFHRMAARTGLPPDRVLDFGRTGAAARLLETRLGPDGQAVRAEILGRPVAFSLGAPGEHLAMNAVAALTAMAVGGFDVEPAAGALADWRPPGGRGARATLTTPDGEPYLLVDESYNANPASVRAALESISTEAPAGAGRRVAFLTDMLELGETAPALHAALADAVVGAAVDVAHAAGPLTAHLIDALPAASRGEHFDDAETLAARAPHLVRGGDVVVVKGSLGSRAHKIAEALRDAAR